MLEVITPSDEIAAIPPLRDMLAGDMLRALLLVSVLIAPTYAADCVSLKSLTLEHTTIETAEPVAAGPFRPPYGTPIEKAAAFCRVAGTLKPSADSDIRFEVWLPLKAAWNGKYLGVGNGGFAGSIDYGSLGRNLERGFATAATNTGHDAEGTDASWAYQHPEKVIDFGYRALHLTTVRAKEIAKAFYGEAPRRAYFDSCSNGGREALMEAQRFPDDFDGILAGAPANYWTHLVTAGVGHAKTLIANPQAYISPVKLPAIAEAVLAKCDTGDGAKDGVVGDPERCRFEASTLRCQGAENRTCLTEPQVKALDHLYAGVHDKSGKLVFPGYLPGAELGRGGWGSWILGESPGSATGMAFEQNYLRYIVFSDPTYDILTADLDVAVQTADEKTARTLNATDADLSAFVAHGGKLILYHGWNDAAISAQNTINYYQAVTGKLGEPKTKSFTRLYMIPGMQHCFGGPGANAFGQLGIPTAKGDKFGVFDALQKWVEQDQTPGQVIATKYANDDNKGAVVRTRPLCEYPAVAKYRGSGDPNDAANFSCESTLRP